MSIKSLLASLLLGASPGAFAINLTYNPDFDTNLDGWTLLPQSGGGVYRDFSFGSPDTGTLRLDALSNGAIAEIRQCVDIHKWLTIDFALRYFANVTGGFHEFKLDIYDAAGCTGNILDTLYPSEGGAVAVDGTPSTGWLEAGDYGYVLKPGAVTARIDLATAGTPAGNAGYLIDHVQVGPLDVVFVDNYDGD